MQIGAFMLESPKKPEDVLSWEATPFFEDATQHDFHSESCSPVEGRHRNRFIYVNGVRRPRRTAALVSEEMRTCYVLTQHVNEPGFSFGEDLCPIHVAAHMGDLRALRFLLLTGASVEQRTATGQSALDLAQAANHRGSHDQIITLLQATPSEEILLEQVAPLSEGEGDED
ncbi:ANK_REP_REGION domain-containing protein [Durusdinium trenchii]|uniref:ANK_REP_REGION domain-containing protein n=1 Tax=Durusdinium trenchii TaxID=1381693 RepID=A0ABP0QSN1_9DINO